MDKNLVIKNGLRISIMEGALAHVFANLTGAIFLPAFALFLGADAFIIGVLAAVPLFATVAQIPGSYLVERLAHRKRLAVGFSVLARASIIPLIIIGFLNSESSDHDFQLIMLVVIIIVMHILGAISGVSWLSWMTSLVPDEIRGRFFGLRNSILGMMTILVTIGGGYFLDLFPKILPGQPLSLAFYILFSVGVFSGLISTILLSRQPEIDKPEPYQGMSLAFFLEPLKHLNFRRLLTFAMISSFAVNFAAPFYVVYMLEDLQMSYTLISAMTVASALADLSGMGIWGHYSDQHGNRPIMIITAGMAAIIPFFWIFTNAGWFSIYLMIPALHILGGFVMSGYNLTSVNLVLRSVPTERNSVYFSWWATGNGILAGIGALAGGLTANLLRSLIPQSSLDTLWIFKIIFILSALMRIYSLIFLRKVKEDKGVTVRGVIRILRSVRSWSSMMGYHPVLQFFLPTKERNGAESAYWPIWKVRDRNRN